MNKATLSGNIGQVDSFEANGKTAYRATLATTESFKTKDGAWENKTEWHNITFFHALAAYLEVGSKVLIEGKIKTRSVEKDGKTTKYTGIVVSQFDTLEIFKDKKEKKTNEEALSKVAEDIDSQIPF